MLKYSELTEQQKQFICNGCGGKGGIVNPPEFLFHASCNQHDFYYWRGCTEADREVADKAFYELMKKDIEEAKWYLKPHYHIWAYTYYQGVRLVGKKFFNYGNKMRTMDDLLSEMRQAEITPNLDEVRRVNDGQ